MNNILQCFFNGTRQHLKTPLPFSLISKKLLMALIEHLKGLTGVI